MRTIGELFARRPERKIEEVIKLEQSDEESVRGEIAEYVATQPLKDHFLKVYKAFADAVTEPHEGIGVWVSGFFGSGKSSFAKILGYTIAARLVGGKTASRLFEENVRDEKISALLEHLNRSVPTEAVVFDVSMDRGVRTANERMTEILYKALLRDLDYSEDFDLAELEMTLERDGRLEAFVKKFEEVFKKPWRDRRKLGAGISEASRILHELDPKTYPSADSWAHTPKRADVTPNTLAERAFDLMARRRPGKALIFVIDEVGQYVSRSVEKILDLQGIVQAFGVVGKNRVKARKAPAPAWIVVTSQEKLDEVVDAIGMRKTEIARLQDRFPMTVDLKQTDIAEVTGKRVLEKNDAAQKVLGELYDRNESRLKTCCALERTTRDMQIGKDDFVRLYPYLPYQIDLSIDIVAGLRLRRGAERHIGGSNRTIIKQAQQMLVHQQTRLTEQAIGSLVTLDLVYELLYAGNLLPSEVSREVDDVPKKLAGNPMAARVAKAVALLEVVKDAPRTPHNLAVVLHPRVDAASVLEEVAAALKVLERAQIVRNTDEGYKILTVEEKSWETDRGAIGAKPAQRAAIRREVIGDVFHDRGLGSCRYKNLRQFKVGLCVDGQAVGDDGQVCLNVGACEDADALAGEKKEAREQSNERKDELFWVAGLSEEIHRLVTELHRSREMVSIHEQLAAQNKLAPVQSSCLADEKTRRDRVERELKGAIETALASGTGYFRGVERDGSGLGGTLTEAVTAFVVQAIPDLYPKLEMGVRPLKGDEAEKFLAAANLNGLPPLFYEGENGLSLVVKQAGKPVPNASAPIGREILDALKREHSYGNKVTGKSLEAHFQGIGYGWERDILRVVLAVLLRAGAIEVVHQGRRYRNHNDPACRDPFTSNVAFRSASFAPREALDLKMLADAARSYEEITGREVDIEEGAIAEAFKKLAHEDREALLPLVARMRALQLPGADAVEEHLREVEGILEAPPDDCVKTLAGEGKSYREARQRAAKLTEATTDRNLETIRRARKALEVHWPTLEGRVQSPQVAEQARRLKERLQSPEFFEAIEELRQAARAIEEEHQRLYRDAHERRKDAFLKALDAVRGQAEWDAVAKSPAISEAQREAVLGPLLRRACAEPDLPDGSPVCATCRTSLNGLEAEIALAPSLCATAQAALATLLAPTDRIERVRVAEFLGRIQSEKDIDAAIQRLREHLRKLLAEGVRIVLE